jgi:Tol biopolymer transport system component
MQRDLVVRVQRGDHDAFSALAAGAIGHLSDVAGLILVASLVATCTTGTAPSGVGPTGVAATTEATSGALAGATPLPRSQLLPSVGRILFIVEQPEGNHVVYVDRVGLHDVATTDPTLAKASWAPGDTILFDSEREGNLRHVFRMGIDGLAVVQLTSGGDIQERPTISPDGSLIAFADFEGSFPESHGLWVANGDGSHGRQLTPDGKKYADNADTSPAFSPDGKWLVFERAPDFKSGRGGLFLIHPDGSGLRRLTDDDSGAGYPRWSPDGRQILFSGHYDGTTLLPGPLWVVDVKSGAITALTDPKDPGASSEGDWSPDGTQIVYKYFAPGMDHNELRLIAADGTLQTTFWVPGPSDGGGAETPDWGR